MALQRKPAAHDVAVQPALQTMSGPVAQGCVVPGSQMSPVPRDAQSASDKQSRRGMGRKPQPGGVGFGVQGPRPPGQSALDRQSVPIG